VTGPTRATPDGRAYLDLRNLARARQRPTSELQQLYLLEGFLTRPASSRHVDRLILKGGVLLAAFDTRRPTRDVDLQAVDTANNLATILEMVREIAGIDLEDGLSLGQRDARAEVIREDDDYSGVRVSMPAALSSARLTLHVDVNVGDPVWPGDRGGRPLPAGAAEPVEDDARGLRRACTGSLVGVAAPPSAR
jgi:hypothetical protein